MSGQRREPYPWQQRQAEAAKKEEAKKAAARRAAAQREASRNRRPAGGGARPPRPQKTRGRWSTGWRRWVKWLAAGVGTVFVAGLVLFAVAYARTDIPDPNQGFEAQTSYVYYSDGKTVLGKFAEQDRTNVELEDVPTHVQDAVIAAEDRTFWTNKGLDPKGILRAAFNNARGGDTQGASTITQQYVKVFYLSQERTWSRKLKEAILSLKIQRQMDKEEILEGYLNTIYFGRGAYGIEAAARAYFDESADQLDVREGAALAAIINSPNGYDPADGRQARQALLSRYGYVIDGMDDMGTLPAQLVGTRKAERLPKFPEIEAQSTYGGQRGHVLKMVRSELQRLGFSDAEIDGGGLRITTTFNPQAMRAAQTGVQENRPNLKGLHVAVASVDPRNGALRGMYGGQDYLESQINWAVAGGAPGSAFKPFSLVAALTYGYSLQSVFDGSSPLEVAGTEFENQGENAGISYGPVSLLTATEKSINTAYVEMVDSMEPDGPRLVRETAIEMGIPPDAPAFDENLSMVLGSLTASPIDMANAYGTIAAGGKAKDVYTVEEVTSASGDVEYRHRGRTEQVVSEEVAADATYALQRVTQYGSGTNANVLGRDVAGKTGTATDDNGNVRSSWFVGYTPQLSTAVMYVRGNGSEPLDGFLPTFYGGEYPARTWASVMGAALEGADVLEFPEPAFLDQTVEGHEPTPTFTPEPTPTATPSDQEPGNGNRNGTGGGNGEGGGNGDDDEEPEEPPASPPSSAPLPEIPVDPGGGGGDGGGGDGSGGGSGGNSGGGSGSGSGGNSGGGSGSGSGSGSGGSSGGGSGSGSGSGSGGNSGGGSGSGSGGGSGSG